MTKKRIDFATTEEIIEFFEDMARNTGKSRRELMHMVLERYVQKAKGMHPGVDRLMMYETLNK